MKKNILALLSLSLIIFGFIFVSIPVSMPVAHAKGNKMGLLNPGDVDLTQFQGPPAIDSEADRADLAGVKNHDRSGALCALADQLAKMDPYFVFAAPLGPLSTEQIDNVKGLLNQVSADSSHYVEILKTEFKRERPFLRDPSIVPCVVPSNSPSYPSGHSAVSRAMADVLGKIYPKYKEALLKQADQVADSRLVGGVHHPLDTTAGKTVGDLVFQAYLANDDFKSCVADITKCNSIGKAKEKKVNY